MFHLVRPRVRTRVHVRVRTMVPGTLLEYQKFKYKEISIVPGIGTNKRRAAKHNCGRPHHWYERTSTNNVIWTCTYSTWHYMYLSRRYLIFNNCYSQTCTVVLGGLSLMRTHTYRYFRVLEYVLQYSSTYTCTLLRRRGIHMEYYWILWYPVVRL